MAFFCFKKQKSNSATTDSIFISCISTQWSFHSPFIHFTGKTLLRQHDKSSFPVCVSEWGQRRERMCVCVTKTMQHYSRLGNYGHNAGLSCKSSLKQKHTRTEDNNYPSRIMRQPDARSHLSKHIDDRNRGALSRLQGVSEICLDPVMMTTMMLQKPDSRVTTALKWTLRHMSPNVLMCQSVSYTAFHVYLCSLSSSELTDAVVSVVCACVSR